MGGQVLGAGEGLDQSEVSHWRKWLRECWAWIQGSPGPGLAQAELPGGLGEPLPSLEPHLYHPFVKGGIELNDIYGPFHVGDLWYCGSFWLRRC